MELPKTYDPKPVEKKWNEEWLKADLFSSRPEGDKAHHGAHAGAYVIVIPPPNITGALHMGHALDNTLQDVLIRWARMQGKTACWVPGTDHGGIATQNVMEKLLKAEGSSRHALGREKFLERMQIWARDTKQTILGQLKRLGCSLDWKRECFTMDEARSRAVAEAFVRLWEKKLIYRGKRMINWCVRCGTALADIEVEHEERHGKLWHIHYPLEDGSPGPVVATTRPETMLGDTAVAVHPEDKRYKHLIGKKVKLPLTERIIPVIEDAAIDLDFGTGALKVTPAHDPVDYDMGKRHGLPSVTAIDIHGKMTQEVPEKYRGLDRDSCRKKVLEDLKEGGFLIEEKPYPHSVAVCYRCLQAVEPLVSEQWFLKMEELVHRAIEATEQGKVRLYPESWKKPYLDWLKNLQDWCISRQIWWGHRIPVWYCKNECPPLAAVEKPLKCTKCGSKEVVQDEDVLDTWFSSALWPFSVFGWPEKTKDLDFYYPTTVLVTGYEILYLWVARMVMMGLEFMGEAPFRHVYLHGIVRDKHGKKMSKSLGNVVDPLLMMDKYGTDAMRFALIVQAVPGRDIQFSEDSMTGARNFANKLYNATRYILLRLDALSPDQKEKTKKIFKDLSHSPIPSPQSLSSLDLADRWILGQFSKAADGVPKSFQNYRLDEAARNLYDFLWGDFCDWYVEISKLQPEDRAPLTLAIAVHILESTLRLLHPLMPYITEELWQSIHEKLEMAPSQKFLLQAPAPPGWRLHPEQRAKDEKEMSFLMRVITEIRTIRSEHNVSPDKKIEVFFTQVTEPWAGQLLQTHGPAIAQLAKTSLETGNEKPMPKCLVRALPQVTIKIPITEFDVEKEKDRLSKTLKQLEAELAHVQSRLSDPHFTSKAPAEEVEKITLRQKEALEKKSRLEEELKDFA